MAALVHGFARCDPRVRIGGVILNRVGSDRHEEMLRDARCEETGVPVLGVLRRARRASRMPSRHLGLIPAAERRAEAVATVDAAGGADRRARVDLDAILALARTAPAATDEPWSAAAAVEPERRRAESRWSRWPAGRLSRSGMRRTSSCSRPRARVDRVRPAARRGAARRARGLVIGGGFPEMYAAELSANEPLRATVRRARRVGRPDRAECAGLALPGAEIWTACPMCGVLDADARR